MDRSNSGHGLPSYRKSACIGALLLLLPLLAVFARPAQAQDASTNEVVIFVLDLSGSMNEPFDAQQTKLEAAKDAFTEAFANVSPDARVGLRTYGDQIEPTAPAGREPSCTTDTRLASPVAPLQRDDLIAQVQGFSALGDTPMGLAIQQAATDIPSGSTGTIVLFSDGRDECFDADLDGDAANGPSFGQDPCEIAKSVTGGDAVVDRIMTVGFSADQAAETELRCIAESTGGTYTAIQTPEDARDVLPELLVQLSAPREAQRLIGRQIQGATSTDQAPDFVRLDEVGANTVLYTDTIDMNSVRIYRMPEYGPEGGTFTATVFGLPPELGIALDMRIYIPQLDQRFFQGEHGDFDAGLPERPTASIRCTDCTITGGPHEAFFVVTLDSENASLDGTYELELLTEGPGFGGKTTSCSAPQECFYPQEIINLAGELERVRSSITGDVGELAPAELIAERDQLRIDTNDEQEAVEAANTRAQELEERIPLAPPTTTSFRLPLLMILAAIGLALLPVQKLRREKPAAEDDEGGDPADGDPADGDPADDENEPTSKKRGLKRKTKKDDEDEAEPVSLSQPNNGERTLPSLDDVGPPPAVSPNLKTDGNSWDAELEAAKAALAEQRPERPVAPEHAALQLASRKPGAPSLSDLAPPSPAEAIPAAAPAPIAPPATPAPISAPPDRRDFTPEEHAAAKLAAEKIAAHLAMEQAGTEAAGLPAQPTTTPPHAPAIEATRQAAAEQIAAEKAAAEEVARQAVERAAAQQAAADALARDTAEKAAHAAAAASPERAAAEAAASRAAEAKQAAAAAVARAEAERVIAQKAAQEAAEKALAEKAAAEKAAAERAAAEHAAAEKAAREAAERAAAEKAATDKVVAERAAAEKAAAEQAAREAAEKAAAQKAAAEQAVADRAAAEELARKAAEQAAAEKAAREAAEQAAAEKAAAERAAAERAAAERAAREAAERAAAEKAAREAAERAAAEKAAAAQAAREAAERAAAERAAREAAERAAAEKAAAEKAAREAAERLAAERAATERAAAQKAAAEAAARAAAEKAAADRAAAEKAAAERAAAEKATAEAAQRLAAEKAAAVQAANELAAAERAAAEAAAQRAVAEEAAARAAKKRAEQEAAAQAVASTVQSAPAASPSAAPMTEEERRQEARRRMLAKQNIVASSSSSDSTSSAPADTAGTAAALRPMTVPPQSTTPQAPVQSSTPDGPGWYEDPAIVGQFRWWDGATWTGFTAETAQEPPPS